MASREEIREAIDREVNSLIHLALENHQLFNDLAYRIREVYHSRGVVIKVDEKPDGERYYGDIPLLMYREGWRRFELLIKENDEQSQTTVEGDTLTP